MSATATTTELLEGLKDPADQSAWRTLDGRMRPVVVAVGIRLGLIPDEAEEMAQECLAHVFDGYRRGRYERGKGRLRSWIVGIARNKAMDALQARGRKGRGGETAAGEGWGVPDEARVSEIWDAEWERHLAREAMAALRNSSQIDARTLRAFELFALGGVPAEQVGAECGMTADQVYVAKNRVAKRLREIVRTLTVSYEDGA